MSQILQVSPRRMTGSGCGLAQYDACGGQVKKQYYVYILAKARNSTFYTGVTNDLVRRVWEHKQGLADGFTKKHNIKILVYYEICEDINAAIWREKLIKKWRRNIKLEAIERMNPNWIDLYENLVDVGIPDPVTSTG